MYRFLTSLSLRKGDGFWTAVWKIVLIAAVLSVVFFGVLLFYSFCRNVMYFRWLRPLVANRVYDSEYISDRIKLEYMMYGKGVRVRDVVEDEVLLKGLDWVAVPDRLSDTLAVFCKDGRRGYMNRYTGQVEIPAQYRRAWVFSEGLAGVQKSDGRIVFINRRGNVVIDNNVGCADDGGGYLFHDGICRAKDRVSGKIGIIDTLGYWVLEPEYDAVIRFGNFWQLEKDGLYGLLTCDLDTVFPVSYPRMWVHEDCIEVGYPDYTAKLFDYEGNVMEDFLIDGVSHLYYPTGELLDSTIAGEDGNILYAPASCQAYMVYGGNLSDPRYGLLGLDGTPLTLPLYTEIHAVGKDLYLCSPHGTLLNSRGRRVN